MAIDTAGRSLCHSGAGGVNGSGEGNIDGKRQTDRQTADIRHSTGRREAADSHSRLWPSVTGSSELITDCNSSTADGTGRLMISDPMERASVALRCAASLLIHAAGSFAPSSV